MSQINVSVTKNQVPGQSCEWIVQPQLIQLLDDSDEVTWNLDELNEAYPGGKFRIEFTDAPANAPLNKSPFLQKILWDTQAKTLQAEGRGQVWGLYSYDIWVSYQKERFTLDIPIDPQIDNIAPPPQ